MGWRTFTMVIPSTINQLCSSDPNDTLFPPDLSACFSPHRAQEEMEKLHSQILALPARRVAADNRRHLWWAIGATLVIVVAPILVLSLLPVALWAAIGSLLVSCLFAFACWFIGVLSGSVVAPTLNDDEIEDKTRTRAKEKLKVSAQ